MTPEQIRTEYVETLARAAYLDWCRYRAEESTWEDCTGETRERYLGHAEMLTDALAAEGKLPTGIEKTWGCKRGVDTPQFVVQQHYRTPWRELPESPLDSGGQTKPMPSRPRIGTSEAAE